MARQNRRLMEYKFIFKSRTRFFKQRIKDPTHGEHGWARINTQTPDIDLMQFSANTIRPLNDCDVEPSNGEFEGADKSRDPPPNNECAMLLWGATVRQKHAPSRPLVG
jgi:hypothetical protein